jgi:O-antigen ligase
MITERETAPPLPAALPMRAAFAATIVFVVAAGTACAMTWPIVAVALGLVCLVLALAVRVPALGFVGALALTAVAGLFKARFSVEGVPSPDALVSGGVDLLLLGTVANLVRAGGWRSARAVWRGAGKAEHIVWGLMLAWLSLSVLQIPVSGHLVQGLKGFRLTQAYVPLVLGGVALFPASNKREHLSSVLLWLFAIVAGYAALQAAIGPAGWQEKYALARTFQVELGSITRDIGSFVSPQELTSFLAPIAVFVLIVGFFIPRLRNLGLGAFVLAIVALLASYVRVGLVAVGLGAAVVVGVTVFGRATPRRTKVAAVVMVIAISIAGYALAQAVGGVSRFAQTRAAGLSHPLSDPSIETRLHRWSRSLRVTIHHPLGTGLGTVGHATAMGNVDVSYTDNSYLKVLQEQGIVGLLFIVGVVGTAVLLARRLALAGPGRDPLALAGLGAFVAFLTICFLGEYIELPGKVVAWTLLGIAIWHAYGAADRSADSVTHRVDAIPA